MISIRVLLVLIFLLLTRSVSAQENLERTNHILLSAYAVSASVDLATTQYGLGKGIVTEANPVQKYFTDKGPVVSGIAKGSMHFMIGYFLHHKYESNKRAVIISLITLTMAQVFVDYHNAKVINRAR